MNPRIVVPDSKISSSLGGPISIGQVEITNVSIPKLAMKNFVGEFEYSECVAKNVRITVKLEVTFEYKFEVSIDCIPDPTAEGSVNFKPFVQAADLGDIVFVPENNINGEKKIRISSDDVTMGPLAMKPEPIGNANDQVIKIENMEVKAIKMQCTEVPLANPLGVFLQSYFPIKNPMDPNDVLIEETEMKAMESKKISSPRVVMKDVESLNIEIPSARTSPFKIFSNTTVPPIVMDKYPSDDEKHGDSERAYDFSLSRATLKVKEVTLEVRDGLEFKNLNGTVKSSSVTSDPFDMSMNFKGMKISGLNLCGMSIPELMVEF